MNHDLNQLTEADAIKRGEEYDAKVQKIIEADPTILDRLAAFCKERGWEGKEMHVLERTIFCNSVQVAESYHKCYLFSYENYKVWKELVIHPSHKRQKRLLYIYGYGGSKQSHTVANLHEVLPADEYKVFCYDYPQRDCKAALAFLKEKVRQHHIDIVMGSSLGGFLTLCLDVVTPKIVVNPCLVPSVELPKLKPLPGKPVPSQSLIDSYAPFENQVFEHLTAGSHCFMGDKDELLGTRYLTDMQQHMSTTLIPSGHRLTKESLPSIVKHLEAYYESQAEAEMKRDYQAFSLL